MNAEISRRKFLNTSLGAGAALAAAPRLWGGSPNEKVQVGIIGCGGIAKEHVNSIAQIPEFEIVALADVDSKHLEEFAALVEKKTGKKPLHLFQDFRRLLDLKEVNAVTIASPDHWHALHLIHACQAGKDAYCEKPISHNIAEGRAMVNAALRTGRVVQVGTQQRSSDHFKKAVDIVRSGALGKIVETQTWNCTNEQGLGKPADEEPPAHVDYDLWLGPAPKRPFNKLRFHFNWRWFFDYAGGMMPDWNVHLQDIVHLAMNAWAPRSVSMLGQIVNEDTLAETPDTVKAVYEFDSPQGPFTQTYTCRKSSAFSPDGTPQRANHGVMFIGRKATLIVDRKGWELIPEKGQGEPQKGTGKIPMLPHFQNFLECIKSRKKTASDIESMHATTAACLLANISYRTGRRIFWDAKNEKCFRDPELRTPDEGANALLAREPRAPWSLPK